MKSKQIILEEQLRLIMECRQSGQSDYKWCQLHDIKPGTFYNWINRLSKRGIAIPSGMTSYKKSQSTFQEVVKIDLVLQTSPMSACGEYDPNEGARYGVPKEGYGALKTLFPNGIYDKTSATVNMSIAFGIRWFEYKVGLKGKLNDGINAYNGGGDPNYWVKVNDTLKIMK